MVYARILAILLVTLGFQIHGFVGAVTSANASQCVSISASDKDGEPGQMVPDKPSPSCKVIGASGASQPRADLRSMQSLRPPAEAAAVASIWPRGPEKPPKIG